MSEICYEPSQIFQPSGARAAPSRLGPPIRLLRSCPVFDALGVGCEALRLGVGWLWCGGLHGSRCRRCRACCGFGPWQSGDAPVDYVDDSHVHVAAAGRVVDRDDAVQTIRERLPSFVVVRAAVRPLVTHAHVLRLSFGPRRDWRGSVARRMPGGRFFVPATRRPSTTPIVSAKMETPAEALLTSPLRSGGHA